ncbi:MFS transporter [Bradyrhizobium genosp. P]|uniref:MFS transporter n=1 Tax=Bradyrhizobium genosp. P TaxID=83641 RepID=UPI003CEE988A
MKVLSSYKIALLLLLAASQSLSFIDRVNLSVVLPELIKEHSYSPSSAGLLMSLLNFFYVGAIIFAGPLTDRIGATRTFPIAVAGWSLATALCGLTAQFWPLAALRALVGIGESPNIPAGSQVIKHNFNKTERGFAVSAQFSGTKIGLAVGIPLSSLLLAEFGRPWVFVATGLLGALWVIAWLLIYKRPHEEATTHAVRAQSNIRWSSLLKVRSVWGMVLGQAGYLYVYYVFASWLPGYLALKHNLPILSTGFLAMLPFVSGIAFTIFGGWASDRLIAKGYTVSRIRKIFAVGGIFGATIFTVVVALSNETWLAVVAMTLAVSMISLTTASANAMPIDVAPPHLVSSCASIQNVGGNLGGALAPLITGLLISQTGGFTVPLLFTALVGIVLGCGGFGLVVKNLDREIGNSDVAFAPEISSPAEGVNAGLEVAPAK